MTMLMEFTGMESRLQFSISQRTCLSENQCEGGPTGSTEFARLSSQPTTYRDATVCGT
ncbi:hypothetical protein M407DRAFT_128196 [Tulasnella calospora MUT 4182]|uniref:Uncharacterized protein n=1 Tax=Tulasnella calospora MUT 4182 TaxID=1051891 RepID=A0A0C3QMW6_9AGAM|nr:hypothetical protein M407DRAFT_128196 [Tulasnella calospora MUT 4182]